jgi:uncharacterized membrane protein
MSNEVPSPGITCPACRMENTADAVFCGNAHCHKALGEFAYVAEQMNSSTTRLEKTADQVARFTAHPHFVTLHVAWFVAWIALNSGMLGFVVVFDTFPYSLLGILLAVEAILLTGFLLISQARQSRYAELRAELDYEVNVRSFRKLQQLEVTLASLENRLDSLEPGHKVEEG